MAEDWTWWWGVGDEPEVYRPAYSRDDAVEQATEEAVDNGHELMTICEGKPQDLYDDFFDADAVLEDWHDHNTDVADEDGELGMEPDETQKAELQAALNEAFKVWRRKHNLGRAWALDTRAVEVIKVVDSGVSEAAESASSGPAENVA